MHKFLIFFAITSLVSVTWTYNILESEQENEYYLEMENEVNWYKAYHNCASMNLSLLTIDSEEKEREIVTLLKDNLSQDTISKLRLWVAGHDNAEQDAFEWLTTGQFLKYSNWASNEPNNAGGKEHCIELRPKDFLWNDVSCLFEMSYICEKNPLIKRKEKHCYKELNEINKIQEQNVANKKYEMENLKELQKNVLNNLEKNHKEQINAKDQEYETLKNSHSDEIEKLMQNNKYELEVIEKFHAHIVEHNKLELKALEKSHENATMKLLDENQNSLKLLQESNALQMTLALRDVDISCENKTIFLIDQKIQELVKQKNTEFVELNEMLKNDTALELEGIKKAHANILNLVRQENEQKLQDFRNECEEKLQNLTENKNREIEPLKKVFDLQRNHTNSFKFYNFVFHGNSN